MSDDAPDSSEARLPAKLWIEGHLRRLDTKGIPYYVVNTGAYNSGSVILKIVAPRLSCRVVQQQRDETGRLGWMVLFEGDGSAEPDADALLRRAVQRDPDLWAIEIEDRDMKNPFEGKEF